MWFQGISRSQIRFVLVNSGSQVMFVHCFQVAIALVFVSGACPRGRLERGVGGSKEALEEGEPENKGRCELSEEQEEKRSQKFEGK